MRCAPVRCAPKCTRGEGIYRITVFGGTKGGTGKSTLAQNVATCLARAGRDVLLFDADDRQHSLANWAERREAAGVTPVIQRVCLRGNVMSSLRNFAGRFSDIVVDVGGYDSIELRSALLVADRLVVPFRPSQKDLETAVSLPELVEGARINNPGLQVHTLLTNVSSNYRCPRASEAAEYLAELGLPPLGARFPNRQVWIDSDAAGQGVIEYASPKLNLKAVAEITQLVQEVYGVEILKAAA